ncbi:unnamed protein product, partial [Adineta steineri]
RNVHQTGKRIEPTTKNPDGKSIPTSKISKKDVQLQKMLANQIILFIFLNIPNPCYLVYRTLTINVTKSSVRLTIEAFINNMTYVPLYLGFALTFANFAVSSKMFRREFLSLMQTKILRRPPRNTDTEGATTMRNGMTTTAYG